MNVQRMFGKITAAMVFAAAAFIPSLNARGWDAGDEPAKKNNEVIDALLITSNYETPRRLATIALQESGAPLILLPAAGAADDTIYLCIPDGREPVAIPPDDLSKVISHINAKQVIVIGGPEFVHRGYRAAIEAKYLVRDVKDPNWNINALILSNLLNCPKIEKRFLKPVVKKAPAVEKKVEPVPVKNDKKANVKVEVKPAAPAIDEPVLIEQKAK